MIRAEMGSPAVEEGDREWWKEEGRKRGKKQEGKKGKGGLIPQAPTATSPSVCFVGPGLAWPISISVNANESLPRRI